MLTFIFKMCDDIEYALHTNIGLRNAVHMHHLSSCGRYFSFCCWKKSECAGNEVVEKYGWSVMQRQSGE